MAFLSQAMCGDRLTADRNGNRQDYIKRNRVNSNSQLHYHKILSQTIVKDSYDRLSNVSRNRTERERSSNIFSSWAHASVTIEASLAVTFFLIFFVSVIHLFFFLDLQMRVQKTLEQLSDETVKAFYVSSGYRDTDEDGISRILEDQAAAGVTEEILRIRFLELVSREETESHRASFGREMWSEAADRVSFSESEIMPGEGRILLAVTYPVNLSLGIPGLDRYTVTQYSCRYGWGIAGTKRGDKSETDGQTVYVTADSQVYHLSTDCTHLRLSIHMVDMAQLWTLKNSDGRNYTACELCRPDASGGWVYITDHGDRYHRDRECSGLKRSFQAIPISQIGDRRLCSRCAQTGRQEEQ